MTEHDFSKALNPFLPIGAASMVFEYLKDEKVKFKITRERKTKFGDFRAIPNQEFQTITINGNLNKYAFLITLVHEIAHLKDFKKNLRLGQPHGPRWKKLFMELLQPFQNEQFFPDDILSHLNRHMLNPKASSSSDPRLFKALINYNEGEKTITVEDLTIGTPFIFRDKTYEKGPKRRTRFICYLLPTKKPYLFSGIAQVQVIKS